MTTSVSRLWPEGRNARTFLGTATPRVSWSVDTPLPGWMQAAYQLKLVHADGTEEIHEGGSESVAVAWPFAPLAPYSLGELTVRVHGGNTGQDATWCEWSDRVTIRTGALGPEDLTAEFITAAGTDKPTPDGELSAPRPSIRVAGTISVRAGLRRALLTSTAQGVFEARVNGTPADDEVLAPGWTSYQARLLHHTSDVSALLNEGRNVVSAEVADGWYRERYGFDGVFQVGYDGPLAALLQLRLEYDDGAVEVHGTGPDWRATTAGPTVSASLYQGETRDERIPDDRELADAPSAVVVSRVRSTLAPATAPPVRRIEHRPPIERDWRDGRLRLDFGQNLVGWLRLEAVAPEGTVLTLRHAEVLEGDELALRPLRHAAATDRVTVGPSGRVAFEPRFTFHGFRYAEIDGLPHDGSPTEVTAVVVHTDVARTGRWSSSHPLLNQLHDNVVWSMRGNFLSLPTDCPQRDERLGWTGDVQAFTPTAAFLYDCEDMLSSWLEDLSIEQGERSGVVPIVVPHPPTLPSGPALPAAAWGDAATLVPARLFDAFGDPSVIARQYDSMVAWVEAVLPHVDDAGLWAGGFQFGDWLDPTAPPHNPAAAKTDADLVATAFLFASLRATAGAAALLGTGDAERFEALAERTRTGFLATYVSGTGRLVSDAPTAYALAIALGLLDDDPRRQAVGDRLAQLTTAYAFRIRTGFVGTPLVCSALADTGHIEVAYRLLLEQGNPSWLYPVTMGATTIWERWDSMLPDGTVNPGEMTSFNHYALGAVADWMHRTVAGLAAEEPGYRVARIAPRPGGTLTSASASLDTAYGDLSVKWEIIDGLLSVEAVVPPNTRALVDLPGIEEFTVGSGSHQWSTKAETSSVRSGPITLDTPLSEVVWDGQAVGLLTGIFAQTGYFIGFGWNDMGRWRPDSTLRNSLPMMKPHQYAELTSALDGLNAARGHAENPRRWSL